jgi:hypothetical protein
MKKIIIALMALAFNIPAANAASKTKGCIDINQYLSSNIAEAVILDKLRSSCGMGRQAAVEAIIAAGGNQQAVLTAALIVDPTFTYAPTGSSGGTRQVSFVAGAPSSAGALVPLP